MAIYAKRRENETVEKLIARFKKQTHGFRLIPMVKGKRYRSKKPTKRLIRFAAIKREEYRAKRRLENILV